MPIVAEIGCNHTGSFDVARRMIETAASFCKVDFVKFQKRDVESLLTPAQYAAPHPNPMHAYGPTYGEHRKALELSIDQHRDLQKICTDCGVGYSCSVWDLVSARQIAALNPPHIKVPSASNLNWPMVEFLANEFGGEIHISVGMTTHAEEEQIVRFIGERRRASDLVLYACTSGYPVAFEDICLGEITRLRSKFGGQVKSFGFSGHHLGIAADVAALALGAVWFERHFTLDRTWKGSDHAASLEPDGMRRLCRDLRSVNTALHTKPKELLDVEIVQRQKLKWQVSHHA